MQIQSRTVFLLLVIILASACSDEDRAAEFKYRGPLLLVGVDGLDWDLMIPLLRHGRLPHLASLIRDGSIGALGGTRSEFLPVTWTSLATGKPPEQHGIRGLITRRRDKSDERRLYTQADRTAKAFWNIFSDYQRRIAIVGWWLTYPVETVRGVMVAQAHSLDQARRASGRAFPKGGLIEGWENQIYPPSRNSELMEIQQRTTQELPKRSADIFKNLPQPNTPETELLWSDMLRAVRSDLAYIEIMRHLASENFDLMALYLGGADIAGHDFLPYRYPNRFSNPPSADQVADFGSVITQYYRFVDDAIGQILSVLPSRRAVLIVSLHGVPLKNRRQDQLSGPTAKPDSALQDRTSPGAIIASGAGFREPKEAIDTARLRTSSIRRIGSLYDVTPTLLAYFGIPIGEDMVGKPITSLLDTPSKETRLIPTHEDDRGTWKGDG